MRTNKDERILELEGEVEELRGKLAASDELREGAQKGHRAWVRRYDALVAKVRWQSKEAHAHIVRGCGHEPILKALLFNIDTYILDDAEGQPPSPPPAESPGPCLCGCPTTSHWRKPDRTGYNHCASADDCGCVGYEPAEPEMPIQPSTTDEDVERIAKEMSEPTEPAPTIICYKCGLLHTGCVLRPVCPGCSPHAQPAEPAPKGGEECARCARDTPQIWGQCLNGDPKDAPTACPRRGVV